MRVCSGSPITCLHRVTLILCIQWILSTPHMSAVSTASCQLSKCGANVAVISKEFPGLPIVRMLEAWVVLQWHTVTDGVGIAALMQSAAVLCACCVFPAVVSSAVIGLCSHFLQTAALQNMVTALQSARSTDCSTGAWWAGLVINLQFWSLQLGREDGES